MEKVQDITTYLEAARNGDQEAFNIVYSSVYDELRSIARAQLMNFRGSDTLNTTAIVHEAYERLVGKSKLDLKSRKHFLALTSKAMRHFLVDYARSCTAKKRGGSEPKLPLDALQLAVEQRSAELEALDEALKHLSAYNKKLVELVELKFFGGFTYEEIAEINGCSERTVRRDWERARTWIYTAMQ